MSFDTVMRAMTTARMFHEGQKRGAKHQTVPYFMHLVDVVSILANHDAHKAWGEMPFVLGWLHDILEDTAYDVEECRKDFGDYVTLGVQLLTLPEDKRRDPEKTEWQIQQMQLIPTPNYVRAVKIADKTSNIIDLVRYEPDWKLEHIRSYVRNARRVVEAIAATTRRIESQDSSETMHRLITTFDRRCLAAEEFYNMGPA